MEFIKVNHDWRETTPYVKVSNQWREVKEAYVKVDGEWKMLLDPDIPQSTIAFSNTSTGLSGSTQTWTVPADGVYRITAFGAQGGGDGNNKGAMCAGEFFLTKGQRVDILVGQRGTSSFTRSSNYHVGGGGGTFVVLGEFSSANLSRVLVIAGGGGGVINHQGLEAAGSRTNNGNNGTHARGGSNGNSGGNSRNVWGGKGFAATVSNPNGISGSRHGGQGGYGGGGGVTGGWINRAGGGGGYSGGGAGGRVNRRPIVGGGGGSLSRGSNSVYVTNARGGHGRVEIDYIRRFF